MRNWLNKYSENTDESEEWVEVNAVWQILTVWIFLTWVWLTAYTCVQDGWLSTSCVVWAWLTIIPVWKVLNWVWKIVPKKAVLGFFGNSVLWALATSLGKYVDDVARLWIKFKLISQIKFSISQVQKKYLSHWADFWIYWNWNNQTYDNLAKAFYNHLNNKNTILIQWYYDSNKIPVYHFYNTVTKNNIMFYQSTKEYLSWWKLSESQIKYLLEIWHIK